MSAPSAFSGLLILLALASCQDADSLPQEPILLDGTELHYTENSGCFYVSFDTASAVTDTLVFMCGSVGVTFLDPVARADAAVFAKRLNGRIRSASPFGTDSIIFMVVDGPVGREKQMIEAARRDARVQIAWILTVIIKDLP